MSTGTSSVLRPGATSIVAMIANFAMQASINVSQVRQDLRSFARSFPHVKSHHPQSAVHDPADRNCRNQCCLAYTRATLGSVTWLVSADKFRFEHHQRPTIVHVLASAGDRLYPEGRHWQKFARHISDLRAFLQ